MPQTTRQAGQEIDVNKEIGADRHKAGLLAKREDPPNTKPAPT